MFSWLIAPYIGTILLIVASVLSIVASTFGMLDTMLKVIQPILTGIVQFFVWFTKEFLTGLTAIFSNLSSFAVILVVMIATGIYIKHAESDRCTDFINDQKVYYEAQIKKLQHPPPKVKTVTKKSYWPTQATVPKRLIPDISKNTDQDVNIPKYNLYLPPIPYYKFYTK